MLTMLLKRQPVPPRLGAADDTEMECIDGSEEKDYGQTTGLEQRSSSWQKRWLYTGPSETDSRCAQSTWCRWAQRSGPILDGDRYHAAWTQPAHARCLRRAEPQRFYPYPY